MIMEKREIGEENFNSIWKLSVAVMVWNSMTYNFIRIDYFFNFSKVMKFWFKNAIESIL